MDLSPCVLPSSINSRFRLHIRGILAWRRKLEVFNRRLRPVYDLHALGSGRLSILPSVQRKDSETSHMALLERLLGHNQSIGETVSCD